MASNLPDEDLKRRIEELEAESLDLKRVKDALRESEEKYRQLVKYAPAGIYEIDFLRNRFTRVNEVMCEYTGYTREELLSMEATDILTEGSRKLFAERLSALLRHEKISESVVLSIRSKGGRIVWVLLNARFHYQEGGIRGASVVVHDITERKQAEEELIKSEKKYRTVVDHSAEGIVVAQGSTIKFANAKIVEISGYSEEELTSRPFLHFVHPSDQERVSAVYERVWNGEEVPHPYFFRILTKEGGIRWLENKWVEIPWEDERAVLCFFDDISWRKQAEQALTESEEQKRAILEASSDIIRCVDTEMKIIWSNENSSLGVPMEEITGKTCYALLLGKSAPCDHCPCKKALETGRIERAVMCHENFRGGKGESYWDVYGVPLRDERGAIAHLIQIARNITDQILAERALERRDAILEAISSAAVRCLRGGTMRKTDIQETLASLGKAMDVSRVYLFENHAAEEDGSLLTSQTVEWVAPGVTPQMGEPALHALPWHGGGMDRWEEVMTQGRLICGHVREFPTSEQEILVPQSIQSIVAVPIFVAKRWYGFVGFDECKSERDWSRGEIEALNTASAILGALIERKEVEEDLFTTRTRLQHLLTRGPAVIYRCEHLNKNERTFVSDNVRDLLGYDPQVFLDQPNFWAAHIHPEDRERILTGISTLSATNYVHEYRFQRLDRTYRWIHDELNVIYGDDGTPLESIGHWVDITERKRAEEAVKRSERELRFLSARLLGAQEDERKRIARDLHDSTCQSLAFMKIALMNVFHQLEVDGQARKSLESVIRLIPEMIDEIRRTITNLRPSILDNVGLLPTISWLRQEFEDLHEGIRIEEQTDIRETDVPVALKTVVFRVLQEALNNIAEHSKGNRAKIVLRKNKLSIELLIEDNGIGFDLDGALSREDSTRGIGLSSMRERVELSGGRFLIRSIKGEGTVLKALWPSSPGVSQKE